MSTDKATARPKQRQRGGLSVQHCHGASLMWQQLKYVLMHAGDDFKGSPVHAALKRLKQLHAMVNAGQRLPSAAWQQLDEDLRTLVDGAQQRQKLQQQVDVNIQKHEQAMFRRLAQLQQQLQQ
jgi:uncharacterized protein YpiB (UPF0302 family)